MGREKKAGKGNKGKGNRNDGVDEGRARKDTLPKKLNVFSCLGGRQSPSQNQTQHCNTGPQARS